MRGTASMALLTKSFGETFGAIGLLVTFATQIDRNRRIAAEALAGAGGSDEFKKNWENIKQEEIGPAEKQLTLFSRYNNKAAYQLAYNGFSTYLSDIIKEIFSKNRNMLRTGDQIKYNEIMQFRRFDDLINYLIDKRISNLSFQSISELDKDMREKYGFPLFKHSGRLRHVTRIAERRNLLVHNGGIISHRYLDRTRDKRGKVGKIVRLENAFDVMIYLLMVAHEIDARAVAKFRLKRVTLETQQNA